MVIIKKDPIKKRRPLKYTWTIVLILSTCINGYGQFNIYDSWDFEDETPGAYTASKIEEDFDVATNYDHNSGSIVTDTINGIETKVLKVKHEANKLSVGFDLDARLSQDFDEVYLSYNFKFSKEFNSTAGGKLPGLGGLPVVTANKCPTSKQGFLCKSMFKRAGSIITYHYDRTSQWCPWASDTYKYDTIFMNNGCWYNITRRVVMNTFTNGIANKDGIHELWVDGRMIYQENNITFMDIENDTLKIDDLNIAHFYGGGTDDYKPVNECYGYLDNFKVYMPTNDSVCQQKLHDPLSILTTPDEITDRTVYYDSLVTNEGNLANTEYGGNYSPSIDETYLIDAGNGGKVSLSINSGSLARGDYLLFYDGNMTDSPIIDLIEGNNGNLTKTRKSTGRYMFVRFSTDKENTASGWSGTVSFESETTGSLEKKDTGSISGSINIYPNPGSTRITIAGFRHALKLQIMDLLGKTVFQTENKFLKTQIDVARFEKGIYLLTLKDESNYYIKKFIKN